MGPGFGADWGKSILVGVGCLCVIVAVITAAVTAALFYLLR